MCLDDLVLMRYAKVLFGCYNRLKTEPAEEGDSSFSIIPDVL